MMNSNQYINKNKVLSEIKNGHIRIQYHPSLPLAILNYTDKTTFEGHWNDITMQCRGLVVEWLDATNLKIVIKSPQKFFNSTEMFAPKVDTWSPLDVYVSEKLDGYYISIRDDSTHGLIVTSRGSFDNKYVDAAKKLLPTHFEKDTDYFCELLQNFEGDEGTIVARHPIPRLVCWGVNQLVPNEQECYGWGGEIAKNLTEADIEQYLKEEVEGIVAYHCPTGERVKVKTEWYLEMHRIISNCTFKRVLEIVCGGGEIKRATTTTYKDNAGQEHTVNLATIPEEHYKQMCEWEEQIGYEFVQIASKVGKDYKEYKDRTPKEYALENNSPAYIKSLVFRRFKTRPEDMDEAVWKVVYKRLLSQANDK